MDARTTQPTWATTVLQAVVIIVGVTVIFLPETRTLPMKLLAYPMFTLNSAVVLLRYWRNRWLTKTLPQLHRVRPVTTLLEAVSVTAGAVATTAIGLP